MALKDRLESIREIVRTENKVIVSDLSKRFGVTEETIRRDLEKLEDEGVITRTYGGAVLNPDENVKRVSFIRRAMTNTKEKRAMARIAASLVPDKASIAADASSTVMEVIRLLSNRSDLLVITFSTNILHEMESAEIGVMSTGGVFNKQSLSLQGAIACNTIGSYHTDIAFVSCKGLHLDEGALDTDDAEAELKRLMISRSQKAVLLADHTKFGRMAFSKLFDIDKVSTVITDYKPSDEWIQLLAEKQIELLYPENV